MKDWNGNKNSMRMMLGINSKYTTSDRENNDYYATDPKAITELLKVETFSHDIWEPSCGQGHLAKALTAAGYDVKATDLIDRGYGTGGVDFFKQHEKWQGDIITNPPYKYATEYARHALALVQDGAKVALFLKITYLEGISRYYLFKEQPPKYLYIASRRIECGKNGVFNGGGYGGLCVVYMGKRVSG